MNNLKFAFMAILVLGAADPAVAKIKIDGKTFSSNVQCTLELNDKHYDYDLGKEVENSKSVAQADEKASASAVLDTKAGNWACHATASYDQSRDAFVITGIDLSNYGKFVVGKRPATAIEMDTISVVNDNGFARCFCAIVRSAAN